MYLLYTHHIKLRNTTSSLKMLNFYRQHNFNNFSENWVSFLTVMSVYIQYTSINDKPKNKIKCISTRYLQGNQNTEKTTKNKPK